MPDFKAEDYRLTKPGAPARNYASENDQPTPNYVSEHDKSEQHLTPDPRSTSRVVSFLSTHEREGR